jgi:hypothetical protein
MSEDGEETATQKRQLRRLGATTAVGGLLTIAAAQVFVDPYEPLVGGLGFLAIATLVFEYTEGLQSGLSLGFITAGVIIWVYPILASPVDYTFAGVLLVLLGALNVVFPPFALFFQNLGRRLGGGGRGKESD